MDARPTIAAIVITHNEAHNITDCLASLSWCDEIIVVDSGSRDATVALATALGARVTVTDDWPGFGVQKQRALALATSAWILSIDADERVTPPSRNEMIRAIASGEVHAYRVPRRSLYVSRLLRHSGWWPDRVLRLARRDRARFTSDLVHERLEVDAPVGDLHEPLLHLTYRDYETVLRKVDAYSTAGARALAARGKRAALLTALLHAGAMFLRTYVLKRGFLDGAEGFLVSVSNAETSFWKYVKLRELNRAAAALSAPPTSDR